MEMNSIDVLDTAVSLKDIYRFRQRIIPKTKALFMKKGKQYGVL